MGTRLTLALALLACILPCLARRSDGDYRMPTLHGYYNKRNQTQSCVSSHLSAPPAWAGRISLICTKALMFGATVFGFSLSARRRGVLSR